MQEQHLARLEEIGLSTAEAQVYLTLLANGVAMGASALVSATGVPRSSVYPTLSALVDKGLVEAEAGYGGRFRAIPAEQALVSLIAREKEELSQRETVAHKLAKELKSLRNAANHNGDSELIQVLRDQRVIAERFERLQLEAREQIDVFIKAPIFVRQGNEAQEQAYRKGVRYRGLYELAIIDDPAVRPYLSKWMSEGEEARVYPGELPHKLAIFDGENILLPLTRPNGKVRALFIRHPQLATSLELLFEHLWQRSSPLAAKRSKNQAAAATTRVIGNQKKRT